MNDQQRYNISPSRNQTAAVLMLGYVVLMSFVPLFVALGAGISPFIFSASWRVGLSIGYALILLIVFRKMLFNGEVWKIIMARTVSLAMLLWVVNSFWTAIYAWSTQFIDVSIATALYETWPIFLVILTWWLFRIEARYRKITAKTIFLFGVAFLGIASVIASQAGGIDAFLSADTGRGGINLVIGVALALGAVFLLTLRAYGFKWAADLASDLSDLSDNREQENDRYLELFGVVVGITISSLITLPFVSLIGFMRNEPLSSDAMMYGAAGGLLLGSLGTICWRMANLIASNLEINVMNYLTPALALGWLFAFSQVGDISVGYLLFGVAVIIAANIGMYLETRGQSQESDNAQARERIDIDALIAGGESETVEFKSTLRFNLHTEKNDKTMELMALKTVGAFLNSRVGGTLIIGVADDGEPLGIGKDKFANKDAMGLYFRNIVTRSMGTVAMTRVHPEFLEYRESVVLAVRCDPSTQPVYVNDGKSSGFYVRTGPGTTELSTQETVEYINERFPS